MPNLYRIIDRHVLVVTALALAATWLCIRWGLRAELPFELIAIAVVFPTAFGIGAAHHRREQALEAMANLRGTIVSIYYAHRDWPGGDRNCGPRAATLGVRLYAAVCRALDCPPGERCDARLAASRAFSELSESIEALKTAGVAGAETSRANQFLNHGIREFERLRAIAEYRTSDALRAYSKFFLNVLPVAFAPFYAHVASASAAGFGYAVAVAFAVVLVGLDNVQDGLENPFDGIGPDDVRIHDDGELFWIDGATGDTGGGQA